MLAKFEKYLSCKMILENSFAEYILELCCILKSPGRGVGNTNNGENDSNTTRQNIQ